MAFVYTLILKSDSKETIRKTYFFANRFLPRCARPLMGALPPEILFPPL